MKVTYFFLTVISVCLAQTNNNYPTWPTDYKYSDKGQVTGYQCTKLTDTAPGWNDNFLCVKLSSGMLSPGFEWKQNVQNEDEVETDGKYCLHFEEPGDDVTGEKNYLCMSEDFPDEFEFITDGDMEEDGEDCIRIHEPSTPEWNNNFLCLAEDDERKIFGSQVLGSWLGVHGPRTGKLVAISVGARAIWGITARNEIVVRNGMSKEKIAGENWVTTNSIDADKPISLSTGIDHVFVVTASGRIFAREGISEGSILGSSWKEISKPASPSQLKQISVSSENDEVWATSTTNEVFYREGMDEENPYGTEWIKVNGKLKLVSAGEAGIWGINSVNHVVYRSETSDKYGRGNQVTLIALRGYHGRYLNVDQNGIVENTSPNSDTSGEIFEVAFLGDLQIALKSRKYSTYLTVLPDTRLQAEATTITDTEKFYVKLVGNGKVGLYHSKTKRYLQVSSNPRIVRVDRVWLLDWEKVQVEIKNGANFWTPLGEGWHPVEGSLSHLESSYGAIWGTDSRGGVQVRLGISKDHPTGDKWKAIGGGFQYITSSSANGWLWGFNRWGGLYYRKPSFSYAPGEGLDWVKVHGRVQGSISAGQAGVWGTVSNQGVYYRTGTYDHTNYIGTKWEKVGGSLKLVSVGIDIVWAVNALGGVFTRDGITEDKPTGETWNKIDKPSDAKFEIVSVNSANNDVWASTRLAVYHRQGTTLTTPKGTSWNKISYPGMLKYVTVGNAGVWALDNYGRVKYREGTYDNGGTDGTSWKDVAGNVFTWLASGDNIVIGSLGNRMWVRTGINEETPMGKSWKLVSGHQVANRVSLNSMEHDFWAIDQWGHIYKRTGVDNEI